MYRKILLLKTTLHNNIYTTTHTGVACNKVHIQLLHYFSI